MRTIPPPAELCREGVNSSLQAGIPFRSWIPGWIPRFSWLTTLGALISVHPGRMLGNLRKGCTENGVTFRVVCLRHPEFIAEVNEDLGLHGSEGARHLPQFCQSVEPGDPEAGSSTSSVVCPPYLEVGIFPAMTQGGGRVFATRMNWRSASSETPWLGERLLETDGPCTRPRPR